MCTTSCFWVRFARVHNLYHEIAEYLFASQLIPDHRPKAKKQYHNNITVIISFIIIMIIVSIGRLNILYYLQMNVCGVQIRKWTCYFLTYIHITYLYINIRVLVMLLLLHRIGYNQLTATETNSMYSLFHLKGWMRYTQNAQLRDLFISQVFYGVQLLPLEHCSRDQ